MTKNITVYHCESLVIFKLLLKVGFSSLFSLHSTPKPRHSTNATINYSDIEEDEIEFTQKSETELYFEGYCKKRKAEADDDEIESSSLKNRGRTGKRSRLGPKRWPRQGPRRRRSKQGSMKK